MRKYIIHLLSNSIFKANLKIIALKSSQCILFLYGCVLCFSPVLVLTNLLKEHTTFIIIFIPLYIASLVINFNIIQKSNLNTLFEKAHERIEEHKDYTSYHEKVRFLLKQSSKRKLNALEYATVREFLTNLKTSPVECGVHCENSIFESGSHSSDVYPPKSMGFNSTHYFNS